MLKPKNGGELKKFKMTENKMIACEGYAIRLESSGHNFLDNDGKITNRKRSPKKSPSGLYYVDCLICGRTVFEDGSGSANGGCYK